MKNTFPSAWGPPQAANANRVAPNNPTEIISEIDLANISKITIPKPDVMRRSKQGKSTATEAELLQHPPIPDFQVSNNRD